MSSPRQLLTPDSSPYVPNSVSTKVHPEFEGAVSELVEVEPSVGGALNGPSSDNITFRWFSSLQTSTKASTIVQNETRLKTRPRPSSRSWFNPTPVLSQDSVSALHRLHIPSFRQETNPILATYPLGISPKCFTNYKVGHPCGEIKIGEALVKNKLIPNTKGFPKSRQT
ncbi:hypothetical protein CK203_070965 [Vitis vinifera]|uniref:Uncharacterized protein n=1 Tax=Vitis vinifera TaxID=29760 RepID=A0A438E9R0_VITVI|nr:hypothetical protein CK203_070965 [Vitis vinifera]